MNSPDATCFVEDCYSDAFNSLGDLGCSQPDLNLATKHSNFSPYTWDGLPLPYSENDGSLLGYLDSSTNFNLSGFDCDLSTPLFSDDSPSSSDSGNHSPPSLYNAIFPSPRAVQPVKQAFQKFGKVEPSHTDCVTINEECRAPEALLVTSTIAGQNPASVSNNASRLIPVQIPGTKHPFVCVNPSLPVQTVEANAVAIPTTAQAALPLQYVKVNDCSGTDSKSSHVGTEEYERKRADRRIRNRAHAQLSRVRRRNEYEQMKQSLATKEALIDQLRRENATLKKTIEELQNKNATVRGSGLSWKNLAAGATLLLTIVTLASLSGTNIRSSESVASETVTRIGKDTSMVLANDEQETYSLSKRAVLGGIPNGSHITAERLRNENISYDCYGFQKIYLNQTETIRLNNDVFDWVNRHEGLNFLQFCRIFRAPLYKGNRVNRTAHITNVAKNSANDRSQNTTTRRRTTDDKREAAIEKAARERAWRHIDIISTTNAVSKENAEPMGIVTTAFDSRSTEKRNYARRWSKSSPDLAVAESKFIELTQSLRQREDTLYVVAMKNYYLLPPSNRNSTMRPRLAMILPALSYNGTLPNQVAMMRIECDITGTGLFHLSSTLMPLFYEPPYQV